ncbi:hypothetical protein RFI_02087 [Reticulomyxa filosa]|uniref:Uncharacterized protein n=1 Tax=Reticulomyxa filosa TaxID=46433 RepID=X6P9X9_RETFI|nr:hypothetical protein RFI_02087 [Reticulomyxa filosa]|eukprot:ETO34986.1 hypothetical protein RFI_02087 [Reticulomyxa filosa]
MFGKQTNFVPSKPFSKQVYNQINMFNIATIFTMYRKDGWNDGSCSQWLAFFSFSTNAIHTTIHLNQWLTHKIAYQLRQKLNVFSSIIMVLTWAPTIALLYAFAHFQSRVAAESKSLTECCIIVQLRFLVYIAITSQSIKYMQYIQSKKDKFTVIVPGGDIQMDAENFPCDVQSCITQIQDNQTEKVCKIDITRDRRTKMLYLTIDVNLYVSTKTV